MFRHRFILSGWFEGLTICIAQATTKTQSRSHFVRAHQTCARVVRTVRIRHLSDCASPTIVFALTSLLHPRNCDRTTDVARDARRLPLESQRRDGHSRVCRPRTHRRAYCRSRGDDKPTPTRGAYQTTGSSAMPRRNGCGLKVGVKPSARRRLGNRSVNISSTTRDSMRARGAPMQ